MLSEYEKKKILLKRELNDRLIRKHELEEKLQVLEDLKKAITLIEERKQRDIERGLTDTVKLRSDDVKHIETAQENIKEQINQLNKELVNLGIELDNLRPEKYIKSEDDYLMDMWKETKRLKDEAIELRKRFEDINKKEEAGKRKVLKISGNI